MPIIDIQRRLREAGRIRTGEQVASAKGKRPAKLENFRITSSDRDVLDAAANLYGGEVRKWEDAPGGAQWELYTEAATLDVIVPPSDLSFSQWYELWNAGGCTRRCDGVTNLIDDSPCSCDPDPQERECKITTRLTVMLPDLPTFSTFRLESHGYNAAAELGGVVSLIQQAALHGSLLPAKLRLEQRQTKRIVNGKSVTRNFAVPVLDIALSTRALLALGGGGIGVAPGAAPPSGALTPVPDAIEGAMSPAEAIEALEAPPVPKPRANAAEPIPATGRRPRTVEEAGTPVVADDVLAERAHAMAANARERDAADPDTPAPPETIDLATRRKAVQGRLQALPAIVAETVKAEWPGLNLPTLRKGVGWHEQNMAIAERLADAAEDRADELTKERRQQCAIYCRDLGMDDDARHVWVAEHFDGLAGLTALTLDQLDSAAAQLAALVDSAAF